MGLSIVTGHSGYKIGLPAVRWLLVGRWFYTLRKTQNNRNCSETERLKGNEHAWNAG